MRKSMISLVLILLMSASLSGGALVGLEDIVDAVVAKHMSEKQIPGLSVAVVHQQRLVFSKGYGLASTEFDVKANADTVYPISWHATSWRATNAGDVHRLGPNHSGGLSPCC